MIIFFVSFSAKSQNWNPEFVKSLSEYYFIPVEFENLGEWIADIENDSSLIFTKKILTNVNDSLYLNFELQKQNFSPPFKHSIISLRIIGNTIIDKKVEFGSGGENLIKVIDLPPRKVTTLSIYASIIFDSTTTGRSLATQTQKELEDQFGAFFVTKRVDKSNKNIRKRRFHREVERSAYFKRENDLVSMFRIRTYNLSDSNNVELCIAYELNH